MADQEPWFYRRIRAALDGDVRFENSLYGPLNTYLTACFRWEQNFMVKPQGLLRRPRDDNAPGGERTSIDSTGDTVNARGTGRHHFSRILPHSDYD